MAYGISVKNDAGHILISSETASLHYAGTATLASWTPVLTDYSDYDSVSNLTPRQIFTYTMTLPGTSSSNIPVFFIRPNSPSSFHSILNQYNVGETWTVVVLVSGSILGIYPVTGDGGERNVSQLYRVFLGRPPDASGLAYWKQQFGETLTLASITTFKNAVAATLNTPAAEASYSATYGAYSLARTKEFILKYGTAAGIAPVVAPQIFAFTNQMYAPVGTMGLQTFSSNGTKLFDSRCGPLAIAAAGAVIPSTKPYDDVSGIPRISGKKDYAWKDQNLDFNFRCDNSYNVFTSETSELFLDLMFSAPAVAQAVYTRTKYGYKFSPGGTYSSDQVHESTATWWAMYHSAYRIAQGQVHAGWGIYRAGFLYSIYAEEGNWASGGGINTGGGAAPFHDNIINLSYNTVITANARNYEP